MDSSSNDNTSVRDHRQIAEQPRLCAGGCGFFGSAANNGLCSKCYTNYLKEKMTESEVSSVSIEFDKSVTISDETNKIETISTTPVAAKNRCGCCNKKIGVLGFKCKCGGNFCSMHRLPEAHPCTFDFKKVGKIAIEKQNPICKGDKMVHRIQ